MFNFQQITGGIDLLSYWLHAFIWTNDNHFDYHLVKYINLGRLVTDIWWWTGLSIEVMICYILATKPQPMRV